MFTNQAGNADASAYGRSTMAVHTGASPRQSALTSQLRSTPFGSSIGIVSHVRRAAPASKPRAQSPAALNAPRRRFSARAARRSRHAHEPPSPAPGSPPPAGGAAALLRPCPSRAPLPAPAPLAPFRRCARRSTHHAPEHRRAVDSGDHAVGTPHAARLHDAPRARLARRRRRRHALPAVAGDGRRASAQPAPRAPSPATTTLALTRCLDDPARLPPAHRPHAHGQGGHDRPRSRPRSTTGSAAPGERARRPHLPRSRARGAISARRRPRSSSASSACSPARPIASSPSRPRFATSCCTEHRIGRADQYRVVPLGFDLSALAADRRSRPRGGARESRHRAGRARRLDGRPADGDQTASSVSRDRAARRERGIRRRCS